MEFSQVMENGNHKVRRVWIQATFGYRQNFIQGACPWVPTLIHTFTCLSPEQTKAGIIVPSFSYTPSKVHTFLRAFQNRCYSKSNNCLLLRMFWDAFKGSGRQRTEWKQKESITISRCLHRLSLQYHSSNARIIHLLFQLLFLYMVVSEGIMS